MQIELTNKDTEELRRLRRCLNSKMIPIGLVESFLERLEQKIERSEAPAEPRKRNVRKHDFKEHYRVQLHTGR